MSTRCQVKVVQEGLSWEQAVTLYHHCDGYPSNMVPLIQRAHTEACEALPEPHQRCALGRAGKVAAQLCATEPDGFEPEEGHELHGDIEFYYVVTLLNTKGGTLAEEPTWLLTVYEDPPTLKRALCDRAPLMTVDGDALEAA